MSKTALSAVAVVLALTSTAIAQVTPTPAPSPTPQPPVQNRTPMQNQMPMQNNMGARVSEAEVRTNLQQQGYTQITAMAVRGADYEVRAMKGNQAYMLVVDGATGQVKSATPG